MVAVITTLSTSQRRTGQDITYAMVDFGTRISRVICILEEDFGSGEAAMTLSHTFLGQSRGSVGEGVKGNTALI